MSSWLSSHRSAQVLSAGVLAGVLLLAWYVRPAHDVETSSERSAVMSQVLALVEAKAVGLSDPRWPAVREQAQHAAAKAASTAALYTVINQVLATLSDGGHSFAVDPGRWRRLRTKVTEDAADSLRKGGERVHLLQQPGRPASALLVEVPTYAGMDHSLGMELSKGLTREIFRAAVFEPCAVIIDLRRTGGGNMWPGLIGIRAFVDPLYMGTIVDRHERPIGSYRQLAELKLRTDLGAEALPLGALAQLPLAILIGPGTASASEAIAAFLRARPNSAMIGQSTAGFTSTNEKFDLPDGGALVLATGRLTDSTGKGYRGPMQPDISADGPSGEDAVDRAIEWAAAACRN